MSNNNNGLYTTENSANFPYKTNNLTEKEIREMKGVLNNIRKHHWDNGPNKGLFSTTNSEYLKYNAKEAKTANIPLSEEHKNSLRYSNCEFGKGNVSLISTQFNSYLPNNGFKPYYSDGKLKNSSINFNPHAGSLKGNTTYTRDYTIKENVE